MQCALLHDTLEDTTTQEADLAVRFSADVVAGVRALTKDASLAKFDAMADSLRRIQRSREVWAVKLANRISNLGPPPSHWTTEKIAGYQEEARTILAALGEAHDPLARRLATRISEYPPRTS